MYHKLLTGSHLEDVFQTLSYCRYEPRSKCVLGCNEDAKQGVISERRQTYYHVIGWPEMGIPVQDAEIVEISESEYNELKTQLDKEDAESEAITKMREKLNEHGISIDDLTDAVLELAEIIGG